MYNLNFYLSSDPGTMYPSFLQAACARRGEDTIRVYANPNGHFLRLFDTVDDLIMDILSNAHRASRYQGLFCVLGQPDAPLFDCDTCDAPVQWILDNAHRVLLESVQAVSRPGGCRYCLDGIGDGDMLSDWSLDLRVTYL